MALWFDVDGRVVFASEATCHLHSLAVTGSRNKENGITRSDKFSDFFVNPSVQVVMGKRMTTEKLCCQELHMSKFMQRVAGCGEFIVCVKLN